MAQTSPVLMHGYMCETRVVAGLGAVSLIEDELRTLKISRPLLVSDRNIAKAQLLEQWLTPALAKLPRVLANVNPDLTDVAEGVKEAKIHGTDGVIIIGGGSTLCLGKAIAIMLTNEGSIADYNGLEKAKRRPAPVIAVPTTAGSGSEASQGLVLHEKGCDREYVIRGRGNEPRVALLDGNLLVSCPPQALLEAALDAMTHACEALWVRRRSLITSALAEKALRTFLTVAPSALQDRDPKALQSLLVASTAANLACGNTGLGLVHALSAAPDLKLPHGYQNGCLLIAVAQFNRSYLSFEHQALIDQLQVTLHIMGWSGNFKTGEIADREVALMVKASTGHTFRANNIRPSTDEELFEILKQSGATINDRS